MTPSQLTITAAKDFPGDLLEPLADLRTSLRERGEGLPPDWPSVTEQDLRLGKLLGWVASPPGGPARALSLLAIRGKRGFGQVHLWEGVDPGTDGIALLESLVRGTPPDVVRLDLAISSDPDTLEQALIRALRASALRFEIITRHSMTRSLDPAAPPAPPPLPPGFRFAPALAFQPHLLALLDFQAFQGGPDAGMVAENPADNQRLIEGLLEGDLGPPIREASPALLLEKEGPEAQLAGFVLALEDNPQRALIADVAVLPAFRGKGLGKALLVRSLRGLIALGFSEVLLWVTEANTAARRLYQSAGFQALRSGHILRWTRDPSPPSSVAPSP
jgi:ribosomal protein S18 acetylase RimI-like enzyme